MITSEQAFDMLPSAIAIYEKLVPDIKAEGVELAKKEKDKMQVGLKAVLIALKKNAPKIKNEIFEVVAIAQDISIEEAKQAHFAKTFKVITDILSDKELVSFFNEAME